MGLFSLGQLVATPGALAACEKHGISPQSLIDRHAAGDWGDLGSEDKKANADAVQHGDRILSCYKLHGEKFYLITEWDRSVTTLLLAGEY